jgi:hypothetical protein
VSRRPMRWHKLGRIFAVDKLHLNMQTHAAVPCVFRLNDYRYRIFFSARDEAGRSHVGWFEFDVRQPSRISSVSESPCLSPGSPGFFDDSGVMLTWIHQRPNASLFYYIGWNRAVTVPFQNALGVAVLEERESLQKAYPGPILDRSIHDPCFVASACAMQIGDRWQMWYLSCIEWRPVGPSLRHRYHIKHAFSNDGLAWDRRGEVCIDFASPDEYALSRPSVVFDGQIFRMWYSYRGHSYRIGYAESPDGLHWTRLDHLVGIDVSSEGWDSEMIEYPCVFDCDARRYMLYNGNGYGKSGIGLAVLEHD